ncbi:hypothetical protein S40285_00281 [Stachybotrys chlorohalonatus IBT 40285]|uniref:Uncharacterized protein n=1 Tax=Stachybotrys chlorohalonatus (strain IBT 40285) TaxID=1283841 RepID=A0A084QHK4_STAC4|nr:hypothetical protein S40285_00281 [Stachybotrys chlorohalonata IBT 40285]
MDRPEPGLVKWSANASVDAFVHINLQHRVVHLYEPTGHARKGHFDYKHLSKHDDFPPLTTYDWSPAHPGLLAVGTGSGLVNLLRIDDGSTAYLELGLKMSRTCQAVAFNTNGLLAVGLDRVRMDQSLHVWDVERLSRLDDQSKGFPSDSNSLIEPRYRLEPSVSVSSIKFFEDNPQTLVAGIKAQGLRIHDLREPGTAITFQTKCNNNLAIDYADQNYFASSALDHPGVMIWDRRCTSRSVVSQTYLQTIEEDDIPWGGALRLDRVIHTDYDPDLADSKHSLIRSLRYCRDQRGLLAVLSRSGQLTVLETHREIPNPPEIPRQDGPTLLHVHKSHEMDLSYRDNPKKNDRIVSFDWVTLASAAVRPRVLVLRENGAFDILEQPSKTADHVFKLVPWQTPHRGLEEGFPYHSLMKFEPGQASEMLGPLLAEQTLSQVPIFKKDDQDIEDVIDRMMKLSTASTIKVEHVNTAKKPLPQIFHRAPTVARKLKILRAFINSEYGSSEYLGEDFLCTAEEEFTGLSMAAGSSLSLASTNLDSCRERHEALLGTLVAADDLPPEAHCIIDHAMIYRAKERYLLDPVVNRALVSDDVWTRFVWDWIADAQTAAEDGGMVLGNTDLSFLGVHSVWTNDLGRNSSSRLATGSSLPDEAQWERIIGAYCKKHRLPKFEGTHTRKPHHRQLCLEICTWGDQDKNDANVPDQGGAPDVAAIVHTMAAARSLFKGNTKQAIQILKIASTAHPQLLFVSLSLQLMGRATKNAGKERLDFDGAVASKTDPYLRAISAIIATGDWSVVANQRSLPLADRAYVAVRNFSDDELTVWLREEVSLAKETGDIEGIVLTGITEAMVDIFARYVQKFNDFQTATLVLSISYPRYIDDIRCRAWRNAYRAHLQRHKLFFQRTKFEVESTKRSKRDGVPTLKLPSRQISLRCVYCDAETSLARQHAASAPTASALETRNPLLATSINAGVSCPNCGRHLPRCVVCLEVVGVPRSDRPEDKEETRMAGRFPTFCLRCEHVLHLDHARQWFARHTECPVPECRCRCNFRANPELDYH